MKLLIRLFYALGVVYGTSAVVYQRDPTNGGSLRGKKRSSQQISERMLATKSNHDYYREVIDKKWINLNELDNEYQDVYWIGSNNLSTQLTCNNHQRGEIMTGICVPGIEDLKFAGFVKEVAKCQIGGNVYMRAIRCAKRPKQDFAWHDPNQPTWSGNNGGNFNNGFHTCNDSSQFIAGFTFGDKSNNGGESITCASGNTATTGYEVRLSQDEKKENICSAGRTAVCPIGYVVTSVCMNGNDGPFWDSSRCGQDYCSNSEVPQQYVKSAVQCTKIAGYELKEESEDEQIKTIDDGAAKQFVKNENCIPRIQPGNSDFVITESITVKSTYTREERSTTVKGDSFSKTLSTTATIGAEYGFAKSKVTGSVSNTIGSEVTSSFSDEQTFVDQISKEESTTTSLTTSIPLPGTTKDLHLVLIFSTVLEGAGDYTIKYNEYLPGNGNTANVVSDDVRIQTVSAENANYIIVLSGSDVDTVRNRACKDVAEDFLNRRGLFQTTELEENSGSSQEDMNLKVFMTKPEPTNAPTKAPTSAPTVSPTLRPTTPAPTTTAPTESPTKASMPTTTQYTCVAVACSDGSDGSTCGSDGGCCPFADTPSKGQCSCGTSWSDANVNKIPCDELTQQQPEPQPETASPTSNPATNAPTKAPTSAPSANDDTGAPTAAPTAGPTAATTEAPTAAPSVAATTEAPTIAPSVAAITAAPTVAASPTNAPSVTQQQPEPDTTSKPTSKPTNAPVENPDVGEIPASKIFLSCNNIQCSDGSDGASCNRFGGCCPFPFYESNKNNGAEETCYCGLSREDAKENNIPCNNMLVLN